ELDEKVQVVPVVLASLLEKRDAQHSHHQHHGRSRAENEVGAQQPSRLNRRQRRLEQGDFHRQRRDQREGGEVVKNGHRGGCVHVDTPWRDGRVGERSFTRPSPAWRAGAWCAASASCARGGARAPRAWVWWPYAVSGP